jgi:hypothetical protein
MLALGHDRPYILSFKPSCKALLAAHSGTGEAECYALDLRLTLKGKSS